MLKRVPFIAIVLVCLNWTYAKSQMPSDFCDLKSQGLKGPVKKIITTDYSEKQLIDNKPIRPQDFINKEVLSFNEKGGIGISETTEGASSAKAKSYYIKAVPLSLTEFPLKIDILTFSSRDGSAYEEMENLRLAVTRKWIAPNLWVTNYYSHNGQLNGEVDSTWIDTSGRKQKTKSIIFFGTLKVTKIVELRNNEQPQRWQRIIRTSDSQDSLEKTTITDISGLQIDQYGNPTYFIYRNTTTGKVKVVIREIEYYR